MKSPRHEKRQIIKIAKDVLPLYKARDLDGDGEPETLCNFFVNDVATKVGCISLHGLLANQMIHLFDANIADWQPLDPDEAQAEANLGRLVIAGWCNPHGGHGHVCIIIPGTLTWSKQFNDDVPMAANAGATTFFGRPVSYAFRSDQKPRYWKWMGQSKEDS